MNPTKEHAQRVDQELRQAGMSAINRMRFASRYLPHIIHQEEHIEAAINGRFRETSGLFSLEEGMLVATNFRLVFLDHKPGYTNMQEVGYDVITGVNFVTTGPFTAVTIQTKVGNFKLSYANPACVERFVHCIEDRRIERPRT